MVKFVQVDEDVVSVEMSVDTLNRISKAFHCLQDDYEGTNHFDDRDESLVKVFATASQRFAEAEDEPVAIEG